MNPIITIIVPAYNVEKYIEDCLSSLVNQSVQRHKVVIVNDGSTDGTGEICRRYAAKYSDFISYYEQENKGQGEARNHGMKYVDTPYLTFLDSDDWLDTKYVESLVKFLNEVDAWPEIIFTLPWIYNSVTKTIEQWHDKELYDKIFEVKNKSSNVVTNVIRNPELYALEVSACRKIYDSHFLRNNGFKFPTGLKWEDVPGHFYLLHKANSCMAMANASFFYRINQGGNTTSTCGKVRIDMITIFQQLYDIQEKNKFSLVEKSYVLELFVKFSEWGIDVTNIEYLDELLVGFHKIFSLFSDSDISFYLNNTCDFTRREYIRGFITCLRSDDYLKLKEYDGRWQLTMKYSTVGIDNKKRIFATGRRMLKEQGIIYTIHRAGSKYILKK